MNRFTRFLWASLPFVISGLAWSGPFEGITQPRREVRISSPVQEIVAEVMVEEGAVVKSGDLLARLVDDIEKAEFRRQEKVLEKRQFDHKAVASLAADKIASQEKELEARVEMEMAAIDLDLARRKLEEKSIRSPLDAVVVRRYKEPGESVDRVEARAGFNTVTARVHLFRTGVMLRNQHDRQKTCC